MNPYLALAISIVAEITATLSLKAADGFTRPIPTILVFVGYGLALWLMASALRSLPIGFVYALWSSIGMIGAAVGGVILFGEAFSRTMLVGIVIIAIGMSILAFGQAQAEPPPSI